MAQAAVAPGGKAKESDEVKISPLPSASNFNDWFIQTSRAVATASARPDEAYKWLLETRADKATFESLADSGIFGSLDGKLFIALETRLKSPLTAKVSLKQRELALASVLMKGRQLLWMIIKQFKVSSVDTRLNDFRMFQSLRMRNNDLAAFVNEWDQCLLQMKSRPAENMLLSAFYDQISGHPSVKYDVACYNRLEAGHPDRCYESLRAKVDPQLEREHGDRIRHDFLSRRAPAGVGADGAKGGAKGGSKGSGDAPSGACFEWWKSGRCGRDKCPYAHVDNPRHRKPPSGQHRGNQLCCRDFARMGVCNKPGCSLLHKRACVAWIKGSCKKGDKCELPHEA